jgi:hypothetical protein
MRRLQDPAASPRLEDCVREALRLSSASLVLRQVLLACLLLPPLAFSCLFLAFLPCLFLTRFSISADLAGG